MKRTIIILAVALLFTGCTDVEPDQTDVAESALFETTETIRQTEVTYTPTEEITVHSTENLKLNIPEGCYCERFYYSDIDFMDYWLYIPENARPEMPLVIFLHGIGEVGRVDALENYGMISRAREIYGDSFPFIALNPCVQVKSWTYGENPKVLKALIDYIVAECEIDHDKIIITGHSLGSIGTWYMLSQYGDYFSAAVPVSCGCDEILNYDNIAQVPINAFVGDVRTYERNYANGMQRIIGLVKDAGGTGTLTILPGLTHTDTITRVYDQDVFEWMLSR